MIFWVKDFEAKNEHHFIRVPAWSGCRVIMCDPNDLLSVNALITQDDKVYKAGLCRVSSRLRYLALSLHCHLYLLWL